MVIFDTEKAILAALQSALGNRVRKIGSVPGGWPPDLLAQAAQNAPSLWVSLAAASADGLPSGQLRAVWLVTIVTAHAKELDRRVGDTREAGAYDLVELVAAALNDLDAGGSPLRLARVESLFSDALLDLGVAMYAVRFDQVFDLPGAVDAATLAPFITFTNAISMAPGPNEPLATDTVTLPQ